MNETEYRRRRAETRLATAERRQMQGSRENKKGWNRGSTIGTTKLALYTRVNTLVVTICTYMRAYMT